MLTMNDDGGNVEQNAGYLRRVLFELLPGQEAIKESLGGRTFRRLHGCWAHTSRVWSTSSTDVRPQDVLRVYQ